MKVTIQELAALTGVSKATVDRVLNNRPGVHARTRERILAAARNLNYLNGEAPEDHIAGGFDVLLPVGENPFFSRLEEALVSRAFDFAVNLRIARYDLGDPVTYAERLHAIAESAPDRRSAGVVLTAPDHPAIREGLRALSNAGVPAFTLISDLPGAAHRGYVGMENRGVGRLAGQIMCRFLPRQPAKVAVVIGLAAYRNHNEREIGFSEVVQADAPYLQRVATRVSNDQPEGAVDVLSRLLAEHPDLAGVYNVGAGVEALAEELERVGRAGDIVLIGHELTDETRRKLLSGSLDAIIDQSAEASALAVVEALVAARASRSTSRLPILAPLLILRENLPA